MMRVHDRPVPRQTAPSSRVVGLTAWLLIATAVGCGGGMERPVLPTGEFEADRVLFERGTAAIEERNWSRAREYFVQIRDNYPQSEYRRSRGCLSGTPTMARARSHRMSWRSTNTETS